LRPTDNVADGEVEWRLEQPNDHSV
jgi:hypothetical protein